MIGRFKLPPRAAGVMAGPTLATFGTLMEAYRLLFRSVRQVAGACFAALN